MKKLSFIKNGGERHWVGDGFPVRSIFSYSDIGADISPFLLLGYAAPHDFPPTTHRRGIGEHPHRGFETVTIVYDGQVEHRDSSGGGGIIAEGDVQWMTAASGLVHEEFHGPEFAKNGGKFEMIQLWVNLPAKSKSASPGYQGIADSQIPKVQLRDNAGVVRVIAGEHEMIKGPARTHSPMNVWDVRLNAGHKTELTLPEGWTAGIFVLKGKVKFHGGESAGEADFAVFERDGSAISIEALEDTTFLLLNGEPINEPIVGHGPFVMNSEAEIRQAYLDYRHGKMGHLGHG